MTKHEAYIRLAEKPYKQIEWFTKNFDNEIGAFGVGEVVDGEVFVEKLIFPKQTVNGAHVHVAPEGWGPVLKELGKKDFGRVIFYWHKHPDGSASCSSGDEEDTFDVLMPKDSECPIFGFMQTSNNSNGSGFEYEARIEMRKPIFASITDVQLVTDMDDKIEKQCQKIIKTKVTEGNKDADDQPGLHGKDESKDEVKKKGITVIEPVSTTGHTTHETIFEVDRPYGMLMLKVSSCFEQYALDKLDEVSELWKEVDTEQKGVYTSIIKVKPKKKAIKKLYKIFKKISESLFDDRVVKDLENSLGINNETGLKKEEDNIHWDDDDFGYYRRGHGGKYAY